MLNTYHQRYRPDEEGLLELHGIDEEGLLELQKIAQRLEEKAYATATTVVCP